LGTFYDLVIQSAIVRINARYGIAKELEKNGGPKAVFLKTVEDETLQEREFYGEKFVDEVIDAIRARVTARQDSRGWDRRRMRDPNKNPRY
jgi:hypothetical protein